MNAAATGFIVFLSCFLGVGIYASTRKQANTEDYLGWLSGVPEKLRRRSEELGSGLFIIIAITLLDIEINNLLAQIESLLQNN